MRSIIICRATFTKSNNVDKIKDEMGEACGMHER
jgi:hypothetical protein